MNEVEASMEKHMRNCYKYMLTGLMVLATANAAYCRDLKFEASIDKAKVALGEVAQLGLSFYGTQSMPAPDVGSIDGLEIRYSGPSTMMTVMNGQVSTSVTHTYSVVPLRPGKFQLGPFKFTYKGDDYVSSIAFLEVTEERQAPKASGREEQMTTEELNVEDRVFVTLESNKQVAYVNELIPITVKLYVNRLNVSDIQLPVFAQESFSKIEFKEPKQYRENVNGSIYDILEFSTNIFGNKPGDYRLGPALIKANIVVRRKTARSRAGMGDPFSEDFTRDSFFDDFFARYERHPVGLKSKDIQISVLPIPASGRPVSFSGAVGDYQFIYAANPTKLKAGDPVTLKMEINGTGNLNTVLQPKLDNTAGFKVYEPQVKTAEHTKTFTTVLIPETESATAIPKTEFSYFDPGKKEYVTISQGPIPIQVEKAKEEAPSQVIGPAAISKEEDEVKEELGRDILYIKESPGRWRTVGYQVYRNGSLIPIVVVPFLVMVALWIVRARADRLKRDTKYASRLNSIRAARSGIKTLKRHLGHGDERAFYEALFNTLQSYLGHMLKLPPAGVTADIADGILATKDVDVWILNSIKGLFRKCDEARFAMSSSSDRGLRDDLKSLEEIINYFERKKLG